MNINFAILKVNLQLFGFMILGKLLTSSFNFPLHKMEMMTPPTLIVAYVCAYVFVLNRLNNI